MGSTRSASVVQCHVGLDFNRVDAECALVDVINKSMHCQSLKQLANVMMVFLDRCTRKMKSMPCSTFPMSR